MKYNKKDFFVITQIEKNKSWRLIFFDDFGDSIIQDFCSLTDVQNEITIHFKNRYLEEQKHKNK